MATRQSVCDCTDAQSLYFRALGERNLCNFRKTGGNRENSGETGFSWSGRVWFVVGIVFLGALRGVEREIIAVWLWLPTIADIAS